jgi:sugar lactone lactonase YvrE
VGPIFLTFADIRWPNGLAVDEQHEWLYWADAYSSRLERIRLKDGSSRTIVWASPSAGHGHPYGLAIHGDWLYWTQLRDEHIQRLDLRTINTGRCTVETNFEPVFFYSQNRSTTVNKCTIIIIRITHIQSGPVQGERIQRVYNE